MIAIFKNAIRYHELIIALAWKNIIVRYKQAYLGIIWAVLQPLMLMLIFTLVRSFIGIESGEIPYPLLTFAALLPWIFFQESTTEGINSVVTNAPLIKKIYFPREIFPITAMVTKTVELLISFVILIGLMIYYKVVPTLFALWVPLIILYTMIVALTISFFGAAINVYYRDIGKALPIVLSLLMYASPVMYPLTLVHKKLVIEQMAGVWSNQLYILYATNPIVGIIDSFQNCLLKGLQPNFEVVYQA